MIVLYCRARIGKPKGELAAASLADTKGNMLSVLVMTLTDKGQRA